MKNLICLFLISLGTAQAQNRNIKESIRDVVGQIDSLTLHQQVQEKLYLHLNQLSYTAGDRVWFKAYVLDAALHQAVNISKVIYVELIDAQGQVLNRQQYLQQNGAFFGNLDLPENLVGNYRIRVYTKSMANAESYFITRISIGTNDKPAPNTPYSMSHTPSTNNINISDCQTIVQKSEGNKIVELIQLTIEKPQNIEPSPMILLAQTRGVVYYSAVVHLQKDREKFQIPKNNFPSGTTQFSILDTAWQIISSYTMYLSCNDSLQIALIPKYDRVRQEMHLAISTTVRGVSQSANVSISVNKKGNSTSSISNYLLLQSNLSNTINRQINTDFAIPNTLYKFGTASILDKLKKPLDKIKYLKQEDIVSGTLLTKENKALKRQKIQLYIRDTLSKTIASYHTTTTKDGRFVFPIAYSAVNSEYLIQLTNPKLSFTVALDTNRFPLATADYIASIETRTNHQLVYKKTILKDTIEQSTKRIQLMSAKVEANKVPDFKDQYGKLFSENNMKVIGPTEIARHPHRPVLLALRRFSGIRVGRDRKHQTILHSTRYSMNYEDQIAVYIDGIRSKDDQLPGMNLSELEYIIWKDQPTDLATYGMQSANGVLEIKTKRGSTHYVNPSEPFVFKPLGYSIPATFETDTASASIYWNPNIQTDSKGEAQLSFRSGEDTSITILIEGITVNGNVGQVLLNSN